MATRDEAYADYQDIYRKQGLAELRDEEKRQFESYWNNASRDSGAYQGGPNETEFKGSAYDKSWGDIRGEVEQNAINRFRSERTGDGPDAQGGNGGGGEPQSNSVVQQWAASPQQQIGAATP